MGKIIVFEGIDCSGKETQCQLLCDYLRSAGKKVKHLKFPLYESDSSYFVKLYLNGDLGKSATDTNAYAASMFFAADRYISYTRDWHTAYNDEDTIIVSDRYTTANAVHQLSKLSDAPDFERQQFLDWLFDFEYVKLEIPAPDLIIYIDMPLEIITERIQSRAISDNRPKDIHEKDAMHLKNSRDAGLFAAKRHLWNIISGYAIDSNGSLYPKSRQELSKNICTLVNQNILKE